MRKISQPELFEAFVRHILEKSSLKISNGALPLAFEEMILTEKKDAVKIFFQTVYAIYDEWCKSSVSVIMSDFVANEGTSIFSVWLVEVFPFCFERMEIDCPKGPSTEDLLLLVKYTYDQEELNILRRLISEFNLSENEEVLAKLLLTEAIKSISRILSEAIEDEYKIFTGDITTEIGNDTLAVNYKGAGRVVK